MEGMNFNSLMKLQDNILHAYCHLPIITVTDISKYVSLVTDTHYQMTVNNNYIKGYIAGIYYDYCPSHKLFICWKLVSYKQVKKWLGLTKINNCWLDHTLQIIVGNTILSNECISGSVFTQWCHDTNNINDNDDDTNNIVTIIIIIVTNM